MKPKSATLIAVLVLALYAPMALASMTSAVVGDATMVIGVAHLISSDGTAKIIERGTVVHEGDRIETEAGGHVHVRFVDGGRVSVRPSSRLQIENYSHSDQTPALSRIKFRLDEGAMRSITGTWGEAARDRFRLNTPVAAIGVKGTDFVVTADGDKTMAAVYTGAIVLAPLSEACQTTLGPCQSGFEKTLSESMKGQMIALYKQDTSPQIETLGDGLALNRAHAVTVAVASGPERSLRSATNNLDIAPDKSLIAESSVARLPDTLPAAVTPTTVTPVEPIAQPQLPPQVVHLAWAAYPWTTPMSGNVLLASLDALRASGRVSVVTDGAYVLYRDPSATNVLMASDASAQFRLAGGAGQLVMAEGRVTEPVQVVSGTLAIDFARATFGTTLKVNSATMGNDNLSANGLVRTDGVMIGQTGNASVMGGVSLDGKEAAYLFNKTVPVGSLTGMTLWGR